MYKSATIVVLVVFTVAGKGAPIPGTNEELVSAALARNWDELHRLLLDSFSRSRLQLSPIQTSQPISSGEVRDLKPIPHGRFYAESETSFHHAVNDNGKVDEQSGGHKVINDNGKVQEYDFKPQPGPTYFHV